MVPRTTISVETTKRDSLLRPRLHAVLNSALLASPGLVTVTLSAPPRSPEDVFQSLSFTEASYFATCDAQADVGLGSVENLETNRLEALDSLEQRADALLRNCFAVGLNTSSRPPRFYGAFAFDSESTADSPWSDFPRVGFRLPRFRYVTSAKIASLSLNVLPEEIAHHDQRTAWVDRTLELLAALDDLMPLETTPVLVLAREERPSRQQWTELVTRAQRLMAREPLNKVVLAREVTLTLDQAPNPATILRRLAESAPETTRFAFRAGQSVFLGATPERLVLRLGSEIRTEALAGSVRAADSQAAEQLLYSDKERREHRLVVEEIDRKLSQLGAIAQHPALPRVRQLRHVLHLSTPIQARTPGAPHVLTLAAHLHPTPAVGGVPEADARQFIRQWEGFDRGLYSGAIGWFDVNGDGEMLVALRSGLLSGNIFRLYAGAGIVEDSVASQELDETWLKCQSLLEALELRNLARDP